MFTWIGEKVEAMGPKGWTLMGLVVVIVLLLSAPRVPANHEAGGRSGFQCLSGWDGSHRAMVMAVTSALRDPDSFQHVRTLITPEDTAGQHRILMTYRAKNGFGGYNLEVASGAFDDASCRLTSIQLGTEN
ncbi:hypothetical protein [Hyphomicrobium sp. DY-1]|uniref:hypothetical protein n=1 Tax=Hyphomicrobium sp. DY-1 TaxID=3075650 RepID=UPI0039C11695